ncbi:MAG: response regulator transcription factor, partial [Candidatus Eremiobacteraeota bacterium]|nr:response regulator transcription factor [Candidatus Eremiobacteraeota bacterium]
ELERRGVMLTVLRPGETYRLHPLMREAMMDRVRDREGQTGVAREHLWVAGMLEAAGKHAPALFHLERARDDERLVRFLSKHVDALFADGHGEQLAKAMRELTRRGADEPVLTGRVQGMLLRQRGLPGAHELFLAALEIAKRNGDQDSAFALRTLLLWVAIDQLDPQVLLDVGEFVNEAGALGTLQRATALVLLGWAKTIHGEFQDGLEKAAAAAELGASSADLRFRTALLYAYASTCLGDFTRADAAMSELLRDLESSDHVVLLCYTLFWYARLSLLWGDLNAAADYARQGVALGRHLNLHAEWGSVNYVLAAVSAATGDRDACARAVDAVTEHSAAAWYAADRERFGAFSKQVTARCAFVAGDADSASAIAREAAAKSSPSPATRAALKADIALYSVILETSDSADALASAAADVMQTAPRDAVDAAALASAEALIELASAVVPEHPIVVSHELPAAAGFAGFIASRRDLADLRELAAQLRHLMKAARGDQSEEGAAIIAAYERLKLRGAGFEAAATAALVRYLTRRRPALVEAFGAGHPLLAARETKPVRRAPQSATLTKREAEVLSLLALGLTNKEIAQRLDLSRRTVETDVERVLGKLNAASRTRAVAEAIRTGLLPATDLPSSSDDEQSA